MPANTAPIFPVVPSIQWAAAAITAANTAKDGTGAVTTIFIGAANGSRVDYLKIRPIGTNVATVMRIFINNGASNAVAANNVLFLERSINSSTLSETSELADTYVPLDLGLPPGYKINVTLSTAIAAGVAVSGVGGDY